jgi:hypothetical protein
MSQDDLVTTLIADAEPFSRGCDPAGWRLGLIAPRQITQERIGGENENGETLARARSISVNKKALGLRLANLVHRARAKRTRFKLTARLAGRQPQKSESNATAVAQNQSAVFDL